MLTSTGAGVFHHECYYCFCRYGKRCFPKCVSSSIRKIEVATVFECPVKLFILSVFGDLV